MEAMVDHDIRPDRERIVGIFFIQSIVVAMLYMRVPDLQVQAGMDDAQLGIALMGAPVGALSTYSLASRSVEKLGTRSVIMWTCILSAFSAALVTFAPNTPVMFAALSFNGALNSAANVAINVEADRVEAASVNRIMNRCHGIWSIGYLLSSLVAGGLRAIGLAPAFHLWALLPLYAALTIVATGPMREFPAREHSRAATGRAFVMPTMAVCALVAFGLGAELLEGASRVWATIYLRDTFDVFPMVQSSALPALIVTMAAGRLCADRWIDRVGPQRAAGAALFTALVGVLVLVSAQNAYIAIIGFGIAGLGAGIIYPLMLSAAARLGDRPSSENVASVTLLVQLAMLVAPLLIGVIAEALSVRAAFGCFLPLFAIGLLMSRVVR